MPNPLEEIKLFSEETRAIVRAGLPLDGLPGSSSAAARKTLGNVVSEIRGKTDNGLALSEIVDQVPDSKKMMVACVAAGLKSGRLEQSLELLGDVATDVLEIRRRIRAALVYPCVIILIATGLFWLISRVFLHVISKAVQTGGGGFSRALEQLLVWDRQYSWWPWLIPVSMLLFVIVPFFCRPRGLLSLRGPEKLMLLIPGVSWLLTNLQFYTASRIFSLLVHNQVPLADSLVIAGASSEHAGLNRSFRAAAQLSERGELDELQIDDLWKSGSLPPLLAVALKDSQGSEDRLKRTLSGVTSHYLRRLDSGLQALRDYVPVGLTVFLAGTAVLLFAIAIFWPMVEFYSSIIEDASLVPSMEGQR